MKSSWFKILTILCQDCVCAVWAHWTDGGPGTFCVKAKFWLTQEKAWHPFIPFSPSHFNLLQFSHLMLLYKVEICGIIQNIVEINVCSRAFENKCLSTQHLMATHAWSYIKVWYMLEISFERKNREGKTKREKERMKWVSMLRSGSSSRDFAELSLATLSASEEANTRRAWIDIPIIVYLQTKSRNAEFPQMK